MKRLFVVAALLLASTWGRVQAREDVLFFSQSTHSDYTNHLYKFAAVTDDIGAITHIKRYRYTGDTVKEIHLYPIEDLKKEEGIILDTHSDKDILVLYSDTFSPIKGGEIDLYYLYNGFTGVFKRATFGGEGRASLAKNGNKRWMLYYGNKDKGIHRVRKIDILMRKFLGAIYGIKPIINCREKKRTICFLPPISRDLNQIDNDEIFDPKLAEKANADVKRGKYSKRRKLLPLF